MKDDFDARKNANIDRCMSSGDNIYYKISKNIIKKQKYLRGMHDLLIFAAKYVISRNISYKYDSKKFFNRRNF